MQEDRIYFYQIGQLLKILEEVFEKKNINKERSSEGQCCFDEFQSYMNLLLYRFLPKNRTKTSEEQVIYIKTVKNHIIRYKWRFNKDMKEIIDLMLNKIDEMVERNNLKENS